MKPGNVILIRLPPAGGGPPKLRPALVLATLPGPYQSVLLCGISSQLHHLQQDWDELIQPGDRDFEGSGLRRPSAVRLSYLYAADPSQIVGAIGRIHPERLAILRSRLTHRLLQTDLPG